MSAGSSPPPLWVSVIIPVRDKAAYVPECVGSVADAVAATPDAELIIVDNGSTDGSRELCEALVRGPVRLIDSSGTIAHVRNTGAGAARGEWLYFIDCDCVVPRDLLTRLRIVARDPAVSVTGCRVDYPLDRSWIERTWHLMHSREGDGERSYLNSGNFALRRAAFEAVGGFDESLVTGEDAEIGARLRRAGHQVHERRSLAITHLDNPHDIPAFFKKEVWRGLGAGGTSRGLAIDRPTAFAVLNVLLNAAAVVLLVATGPSVRTLMLAFGLVVVMPAVAVVARWLSVRRGFNFAQAVLLYWVYLIARAWALMRIALAPGKDAAARNKGADETTR